jgi:predicted Zn-dependent peptidase
MQNSLIKEDVSKVYSGNGIEVYKIITDKYKTNSINIFFQDNLSRETASMNAMVPAVLRRGCGSFPTFKDIALYLQELYGASFDCGVSKKGEQQIIQFYIEFVSDRYTGEPTDLFKKSFELLYEIITDPVLEGGVFKNDYVELEKDNLRRLILSRINDKVQYSVEKCLEEMCKDEPFGVHEYGSEEDLNSINSEDLFKHYVNLVETVPIKVYITGNIEEEKIKDAIEKLVAIRRGKIKK